MLWLLLVAAPLAAQSFTQRGFLDLRNTLYPQTAPGDHGRVVSEALLRWEASWQLPGSLKLHGAFDARADTHRQVERQPRVEYLDRRPMRPAFSIRRASLAWHRGKFTIEAGKQFIRWGKADILNPTDRFAPRDYLSVTDNEFLAVTAARLTWESGGDTIDAAVTPLFTPSRTPLLDQRWVVLPPELRSVPLTDSGARIPGRAQCGVRWNHIGSGYEFSAVLFDGFHHLPLFDDNLNFTTRRIDFFRTYPRLRLYGGDFALPTRWFTIKTEAGWFSSSTRTADEYALYVIQLERTQGEWVFAGGYSGEAVTQSRNPLGFAPDRGLARAFLGRASYTIDARRSLAFEAAVRQTGEGVWLKSEYSHQLGQHWRDTAAFTLIRGATGDFLGQYRRNTHALLALRYSF